MTSNQKIVQLAKKGMVWQTLELLVGKGFGYVVQLVLVRILFPEDFGLVGMAVFFTGLVQVLSTLGLGVSLIQMKEEKIQPIHYDTVFWSSLGFNLFTYIIVYFLVTPFAAYFYDEPLLMQVIPVLALSGLINSFSTVPSIRLTKSLQFKKLTQAEIIAMVFSGTIAIGLAFFGFGVYAIIMNGLLNALIKVPFLWYFDRWQPSFRFSLPKLKEVLGNGIYESMSQTLMFVIKNIDYLIIGKLLSASLLGIYTFAFMLTDSFRAQLMTVMNKVMFPVYSKIQNDKALLKTYYLKVVRFNVLAIGPIMIFLTLYAEKIIFIIGGEKWLEAAFPVQMLSLAALLHVIGGTYSSVLKGMGKFSLDFKISLFKTIFVTIPFFYIGAYFWGIEGVSVAVLGTKVVARTISHYFMWKMIAVSQRDILETLYSFALGGLAMLAVAGLSYMVPFFWIAFLIGIFGLGLFYYIEYRLEKGLIDTIISEVRNKSGKNADESIAS